MSELINTRSRLDMRLNLLATVSTFTLLLAMGSQALAGDADHPALWVELGGALDFVDGASEPWAPANLPPPVDHPVSGTLAKFPQIGYDAFAKLTFQPDASDWTFSASVRYGKSKRGPKLDHDQAYQTYKTVNGKYALTTYAFTNLHDVKTTKYAVVDFQAGKDVGIGLLGGDGASILNIGIRVAQFTERAETTIDAQTAVPHRGSRGGVLDAEMDAARSFSGMGPSIAWDASAPLTGSLDNGLALDWGVTASVLFGRQKARVRTHTENRYYTGGYTYMPSPYGYVYHYNTSVRTNETRDNIRRRTVVVPNIGAFAGISYRVGGRGKVSLGYRADFFFGAMDGGIDTHKSETVGFHGPFATISLGLGG